MQHAAVGQATPTSAEAKVLWVRAPAAASLAFGCLQHHSACARCRWGTSSARWTKVTSGKCSHTQTRSSLQLVPNRRISAMRMRVCVSGAEASAAAWTQLSSRHCGHIQSLSTAMRGTRPAALPTRLAYGGCRLKGRKRQGYSRQANGSAARLRVRRVQQSLRGEEGGICSRGRFSLLTRRAWCWHAPLRSLRIATARRSQALVGSTGSTGRQSPVAHPFRCRAKQRTRLIHATAITRTEARGCAVRSASGVRGAPRIKPLKRAPVWLAMRTAGRGTAAHWASKPAARQHGRRRGCRGAQATERGRRHGPRVLDIRRR